jgi:tRNA G18 (ribose-2'-O)-methylase SpoU
MRGYFGIGVEGVSKPMNLGSLLRSAHAFGASFAFTIGAAFDAKAAAVADTSAPISPPSPRPMAAGWSASS